MGNRCRRLQARLNHRHTRFPPRSMTTATRMGVWTAPQLLLEAKDDTATALCQPRQARWSVQWEACEMHARQLTAWESASV